ncbi:MAG TPA: leucyl aminopeptidase [Gammaproteobacteria bacterium]|nr:leucyl aminopeptidase [Gammaproteobacteria bacterium]
MDFIAKTGDAEKIATGCIVVPVFEPRQLSPAAQRLDKASRGQLNQLLRQGDIDPGRGKTTLILNPAGRVKAARILVVGCGKRKKLDAQSFARIVSAAAKAANACGATEAVSCLAELEVEHHDLTWKTQQIAQFTHAALYRFDELKSEVKAPRRPLRKLAVLVSGREELAEARAGLKAGKAVGEGMALARTLGNRPGNKCTPADLAAQALELKNQHPGLKVKVLEEKDMEKLGMGALLSVTRGSREPARLIVMEYRGGPKKEKPVVLVGKGVTFDSGGISLKPGAAMDEMKFDMCGAASVFGVIKATADLGLPLNLVGIVPATENLPDGQATKPGDVVTSLSGQTIEILNTDAEGRLILCDALSYAERFDPELVIDIATLTGACVVALGKHAAGLFSNDQALADALLAAGRASGDRAWQMPLWDEYDEQLSSNFADMANIGGRDAGSITAACFLARFTRDYRWAHLDIAGVAWNSGKEKGATGRPVPLLTRFLMDRTAEASGDTG